MALAVNCASPHCRRPVVAVLTDTDGADLPVCERHRNEVDDDCPHCLGRHDAEACPWVLERDAARAAARTDATGLVDAVGLEDAARMAAFLEGEAEHWERTLPLGPHNATKPQAARILAGRIREAIGRVLERAPSDGEE